ncbi:ribosome biogenesis factor YjgA [Legionella anisa]|uniref:Dual-action ribosomal maturation protein DarP n=1 Tax=Legionella anisa TaxID=28082 RepID=A0AAX0X0Z6_9GAMM|nr:ribosome biogenesis factor YjgA [Legionella anisa]AWN72846.1 ribosome-associated protein [Legionella anisa]KTC70708.1 alpha helix protein [Legionella anisa]MBN5934677.1 ribosome-associated protein [Legionella anisa]MCW8423647.1 ribosome-associated protein [Legionella anisa]MCW8447167.1 ribosome-associated protein [Legionella anisa]
MDEPVSKSQKKRDADFLQKMGVKLIDLSLSKLELLPLPENLYKAIIDAKSIKSHGAKRRQAQLIGKLMRAADHEEILAAYERLLDEDKAITASFHEVEHWRDRLLNEGKEALTAFIEAYQPEDVQHLRQLIKKAVDDQQKEKNTGAAKALFRYLRSSIE